MCSDNATHIRRAAVTDFDSISDEILCKLFTILYFLFSNTMYIYGNTNKVVVVE